MMCRAMLSLLYHVVVESCYVVVVVVVRFKRRSIT